MSTPPPDASHAEPGREGDMDQKPEYDAPGYRGSGKLDGQAALVTGGDSGIGRAVAILFAREGADVAVAYLDEHDDAEETKRRIEAEGRRCVLLPGDLQQEAACREAIAETVHAFGRLDVLVNNAGAQFPQDRLGDITEEQLDRTFRTNVYSMVFLTKAALEHLPEGGAIINSASVTAYQGNPFLIDYSATKGAMIAFTRSLSQNHELLDKKIRINAVAPGPVWTPLIPSSFGPDAAEEFGKDVPLGRPGQPEELAPAYVFLASRVDSSYMTGQTLHVNGGDVVGS